MFNSGYIYVITNESWGDFKKIGVASNVKKRLGSYSTSLPFPVELKLTSDYLIDKFFYEKLTHFFLTNFRYKSNREFFNCSLNDIKIVIEIINNINKEYSNDGLLLDLMKNNESSYYKNRFLSSSKYTFNINNYIKFMDDFFVFVNKTNIYKIIILQTNKFLEGYELINKKNNKCDGYEIFSNYFVLSYEDTFLYNLDSLYYFNNVYWIQDDNNFTYLRKFIKTHFYDKIKKICFNDDIHLLHDDDHLNKIIPHILNKIKDDDIVFDSNPSYFCYLDKVLNLKTNTIIDANPKFYIKTTCGYNYEVEKNNEVVAVKDDFLNWFNSTLKYCKNRVKPIKIKDIYKEHFTHSIYFNNLSKKQQNDLTEKEFIQTIKNNIFLKKFLKDDVEFNGERFRCKVFVNHVFI